MSAYWKVLWGGLFYEKKNQIWEKLKYKITQGFEITQAHFDEKTQSTGGLCHVHPPKKCSKKPSALACPKPPT